MSHTELRGLRVLTSLRIEVEAAFAILSMLHAAGLNRYQTKMLCALQAVRVLPKTSTKSYSVTDLMGTMRRAALNVADCPQYRGDVCISLKQDMIHDDTSSNIADVTGEHDFDRNYWNTRSPVLGSGFCLRVLYYTLG